MSNMNVQQLLAQMRVMEAQAKSQIDTSLSVNELQSSPQGDFTEVLSNAINQVNENQMASGQMQTAFQKGDENISMAQLMVQMEKASVSFQAMTQVRNRLLNAYQEIMNMPV